MNTPTDTEAVLLRRAITLAQQARDHGNHPFGALLVDPHGEIVLEAENTVNTGRDCTGHAETNLMRMASARYRPAELAGFTLYTSTEPCPMCAGAIYWGGVGRVVYALSEMALYAMTEGNPDNDALPLPCREVLARGVRTVEVRGPLLEDEARTVHVGFWGKAG